MSRVPVLARVAAILPPMWRQIAHAGHHDSATGSPWQILQAARKLLPLIAAPGSQADQFSRQGGLTAEFGPVFRR